MEALLQSESRVYVLPSVWNARFPFYHVSYTGNVNLVHGRIGDYEKFRQVINKVPYNRSWNPITRSCDSFVGKIKQSKEKEKGEL